MYFRILHEEASGALSYLLADRDGGEAILVDPRDGDRAVLLAMIQEGGLRLRWVLRTHDHRRAGADQAVALAPLAAPQVMHRAPKFPLLPFGNEYIRVLRTPGHTARCLSFLWRDRLFCGDLLTMNACPQQREPLAPVAMWESVMRCVFTLPAETLVFAGHSSHAGAVSTIMEQRRWHPWFSRASRDEFLARFARRRPPH